MTGKQDPLSVRESFVPPGSRIHHTRPFRPRKVKKHDPNLFNALCAWIVEHQLTVASGLSVNLVSLLALVHIMFPRARPQTQRFIKLQYLDAATGTYSRGYEDGYFVLFWVVIFTGLRAATMDYVLTPLTHWFGVRSRKTRTRLAEQGWMLLYYIVFWTLGMYIMYHSEHWFNLQEVLTRFPTHKMKPTMKFYYLVQFAFWLQQIFVINIEARRKDHWQMIAHHIFTSLLMFYSYSFYQVKIGNTILCIMDVADILLPLAKILKYLQFTTACDVAFGVFMLVWLITRHVFYNMVTWHVYTQTTVPYHCYDSVSGRVLPIEDTKSISTNLVQSFNDPDGVVCVNNGHKLLFVVLLVALQVLTIIWFGMIVRVAYNVLSGKTAEDTRSDDEGESEEEYDDLDWDEKHTTETATQWSSAEPIELEVGADEVTGAFKTTRPESPTSTAKSQRKSSARTSAISIPGHGDRKELLGRIGCDKPS